MPLDLRATDIRVSMTQLWNSIYLNSKKQLVTHEDFQIFGVLFPIFPVQMGLSILISTQCLLDPTAHPIVVSVCNSPLSTLPESNSPIPQNPFLPNFITFSTSLSREIGVILSYSHCVVHPLCPCGEHPPPHCGECIPFAWLLMSKQSGKLLFCAKVFRPVNKY